MWLKLRIYRSLKQFCLFVYVKHGLCFNVVLLIILLVPSLFLTGIQLKYKQVTVDYNITKYYTTLLI